MLSELRKLLSECHLEKSKISETLKKCNSNYTYNRAVETLQEAESLLSQPIRYAEDIDSKLKLAIQLVNLTRLKLIEERQALLSEFIDA